MKIHTYCIGWGSINIVGLIYFIYYCYLHYLTQKCVSCLLGETGASIMGVQEPLASKGIGGIGRLGAGQVYMLFANLGKLPGMIHRPKNIKTTTKDESSPP